MPFKTPEQKKAYHKSYHKKWYENPENKVKHKACAKKHSIKNRERNRQFLRDYKSKIGCSQCDESHVACLDFHHLDPEQKEFNLASMTSCGFALERVKAEIEKCVVLCKNCHAKLHWEEKKLQMGSTHLESQDEIKDVGSSPTSTTS
jgi:transcription elongation factor Elf1